MSKVKSGSVWAWLVLIGCIGFYSIPTGIIANTSGIFVAPVMDQFGWSQTDTTMYRTIQPIVSAICAPFAGKLLEKYDPRWIMTAVSAVFGLASVASAFATELWQWNLYGVVFGVTAAFFMYLAAPVLINIWFEKGAGIAVSISAATLSLLAAIASPVGQALISAYGWQTARLVLSLVTTVASVVLCAAFVRKSPSVMNVLPFGASQTEEDAEERSAEEAAAAVAAAENEGATIEEARKSPARYTLILVAGIFCMCAAFFQQIPAFCAHGELGASVGAMAVSIIMVGGIVGKLLLGAAETKSAFSGRALSRRLVALWASRSHGNRAQTRQYSMQAWRFSASATQVLLLSRRCSLAARSAAQLFPDLFLGFHGHFHRNRYFLHGRLA